MLIWASDVQRAGLATKLVIEPFLVHLERETEAFKINTGKRLALFLAQCAHESMRFTRLLENLSYSSIRLQEVFGRHFKNDEKANLYAFRPEMIANIVYAGRLGNGSLSSGDGWRYRGRGLIQVTGRDNYRSFAKDCDEPMAVTHPDLLAQPRLAVKSACWYWRKAGCNELADRGRIDDISVAINRGAHRVGEQGAERKVNGLMDRRYLSKKALGVFDR